ncbi:YHYH protein [Albimonas donghaensis]|uniref:YHYH protein n=1 Tax=Albimonas donghaensis TaxID=356660 RepID=A0A1H2QBU5_9RHOB|nr:YHYH protein [Albimonas donghaensis]SDW04703.1 YHYH protein [Albimonas donghaensis]
MPDIQETWLGSALAALTLATPALAHPEAAAFAPTAFIEAPEIVACTLENGAETQCHRITVGYLPEGLEIGPFCPADLEDAGGIWDWTGENAGLYRIDGDFLRMLDALGYRFHDDDGNVYSVDNATERPAVDHACINVSADESVEITMLLPVAPVMADAPTPLGTVAKVGVALDGVPIFADAPEIQVTGHMPALDTCGGHIDPGGWYHWHGASTDIETVFANENVAADCALEQDASAQFGYAFDGFAIYGSVEADGSGPTDLDACNGHVGLTANGDVIYHYHAADAFPNLPACLVGVPAQDNFSTTATAGIGAARTGEDGRNEPPRPADGGVGGMPPGFDQAAKAVGVSAEALLAAMEAAGGPNADLADVAASLGIEEDALRAALPTPPGR